jgi:hypothetical protein
LLLLAAVTGKGPCTKLGTNKAVNWVVTSTETSSSRVEDRDNGELVSKTRNKAVFMGVMVQIV